jgi:hypothetical protein
MVEGTGHTNLIFDVVLPMDLRGKEDQMKQAILDALQVDGKTYYLVVTFDSASFDPN